MKNKTVRTVAVAIALACMVTASAVKSPAIVAALILVGATIGGGGLALSVEPSRRPMRGVKAHR